MIDSREFEKVKKSLIFMLTNSGKPEIILKDANYNNAGELLLEHKNPATGLNMDFAEETLKNLYKFWKRPVYLESKNHDGKDILFRCNDENMVDIEEFPELDEQMIMYAD